MGKGDCNRKKKKDERQNLKCWAEGVREDILTPWLLRYGDACSKGYVAERDCLRKVVNEFSFHIDWRIADWDEPPRPLREYDPALVDNDGGLSPEEVIAKRNKIRDTEVRIRRWMKYRIKKLRKLHNVRIENMAGPWGPFLAKVSGAKPAAKARQGWQQLCKESYKELVAPAVAAKWAAGLANGSIAADAKQTASFRGLVAREIFGQLPEAEKQGYLDRAKQDAREEKERWERLMKEGPSKRPEDRQKALDSLRDLLGPVMEGICLRTGCRMFIVVGGPIPKDEGRLGTMHFSAGKNLGSRPVQFSVWKPKQFNEQILKLFMEFLGTCYTADDIHESILPTTSETIKQAEQDKKITWWKTCLPHLRRTKEKMRPSLSERNLSVPVIRHGCIIRKLAQRSRSSWRLVVIFRIGCGGERTRRKGKKVHRSRR